MKMVALRWSGLCFGGFERLEWLHDRPGVPLLPRFPSLLRVRVVLRRRGVICQPMPPITTLITASVRLSSSGTNRVTRWVGTPHWTCR